MDRRRRREVTVHESLFAAWESYYVIIGSSAAALTGLQFVIMALIAESERPGGSQEIAAYGSPTVVHFCSALLISAIFSAPWPALASAGIAASLVGVGGLAYTGIVLRRAIRQKGYKPVFEDWLWHTVLPALAYLVLVASAGMLAHEAALFAVGGAALLLVFIGIHNAWDTVTYVAVDLRNAPPPRVGPAAKAPASETEATRNP
jgi:hypothetical protein